LPFSWWISGAHRLQHASPGGGVQTVVAGAAASAVTDGAFTTSTRFTEV
jgi:hypothetical protein